MGMIACAQLVYAQAPSPQLEELLVTATLMDADSARISTTSLSEEEIASWGAIHFEDLLTALPNVSASAGASRQRFFQIRGIGERSQFIEPINPSVVILQDGVDISGLGAALTLADVAQVDVLRGPQGSIMGAGALGGLINLRANEPDDALAGQVGWGIESYNGKRADLMVNLPATESLAMRIAHQTYRSDGWIDNTYLDRSDTNGRDETTNRLTIRYSTGTDTLLAGVTHLDIANGYDAFSLDNTRETLSDEPGQDSLDFASAFVRWTREGTRFLSELQVSSVNADSLYSYDEDWSFVGIRPGWEYSSFDSYDRDIERTTLEWRIRPLVVDQIDWVLGVYGRADDESLLRQWTYLPTDTFDSSNQTDTWAAFGQISTNFLENLQLTAGGRFERRETDYLDSASVAEQFSAQYWTGNVSLEWAATDTNALHVSIARGARAGGVNAALSSSLLALAVEIDTAPYEESTRFDEESVINLELGWRYTTPKGRLRSALTLFSMDRDDQQVKGSLLITRADGSTSFTDFTDNAATGTSRGLEWRVDWLTSEQFSISASVATLDAQFDRYINVDGVNLSGRDQPQAPSWQYWVKAAWALSESLQLTLEATGRDDFYLSDRHEIKAPKAELVNASLAWNSGPWSLSLFARNLTDELTVTRGFGTFGNDPRKEYALEPYYQFGEPRTVGVTASYHFGG